MEDNNFKEFAKRASVWTAPTGLPIIAGAAYSVGTVMAWGACSIMSLFCSFFLPNQFDSKGGVVEGSAMDWFRKKAYSCYSHISDGVEYGFDSTVQFSREVLHQVFPNVKVNFPASTVKPPEAEVAVQQTKEDPKQEANPEKLKDDSGQGVGDKSSMQVDNPRDNPGGFINEDSGHGRGE